MCGTKRLNPIFRLHEAIEILNKYVMGEWSDSFTAAFFVSFIVIVFVPNIGRIQNKVMFINWNNLFSGCILARVVLICMTSVVVNLPEGPQFKIA